jgi:hypothetical protein
MMRWTDTSRFGSLRSYDVYDDTLTVMCRGVSSYSFSIDADQHVISVDPVGGPRLFVGKTLEHGGYTWTIKSIMFHYKKKSTAVFVFGV